MPACFRTLRKEIFGQGSQRWRDGTRYAGQFVNGERLAIEIHLPANKGGNKISPTTSIQTLASDNCVVEQGGLKLEYEAMLQLSYSAGRLEARLERLTHAELLALAVGRQTP